MTRITTAITDGPPDVSALEPGRDAAGGGECVFIGRTRGERHPRFGALLRLEYEMYEPMVVKLMERLAHDAAAKYRCAAVRLLHARGPVPVGEASVVVQTLTAHRAEAFAATRELIDRLKRELPIWKHEVWERGRTFTPGSPATTEPAHG